MENRFYRAIITVAITIISITSLSAQKRSLAIEDFAKWQRVSNETISKDGEFISYQTDLNHGDGTLILHDIKSNTQTKFNRGSRGTFTSDGELFIYKISPALDAQRDAIIDKLSKDKQPKDSVVVYAINSGTSLKFHDVSQFKVDEDMGIVTILQSTKKEAKASKEKGEEAAKERDSDRGERGAGKGAESSSSKGKDLHIITLNGGKLQDVTISNVSSYTLSRESGVITYLRKEGDVTTAKNDTLVKDSSTAKVDSLDTKQDKTKKKSKKDLFSLYLTKIDKSGNPTLYSKEVYVEGRDIYDTKDSIDTTPIANLLYRGEATIKSLTLDKEGKTLALLSSCDTLKNKSFKLKVLKGDELVEITTSDSSKFDEGVIPSEHGKLTFSEDGKKLYFGVSHPPLQEIKDTLLKGEHISVDIWSWSDTRLIPRQKLSLKKDINSSFLSVVDIETLESVQLANEDVESVRTQSRGDARYALGSTEKPYQRAQDWSGRFYSDYFIVDTESGAKSKIAEFVGRLQLTPDQKYGVYWNWQDSCIYSVNCTTLEHKNISESVEYPLWNELQDTPNDARNYGTAGCSSDGKYLFVYDRYDIWKLDISGEKSPINVTEGYGRENETVYRVLNIDIENRDRGLSNLENTMLSALYSDNKDAGYSKGDLKRGAKPIEISRSAHQYSSPVKAEDSDVIYWTKQSFTDTEEIYISDIEFKDSKSISNINTQQEQFNWGYTEVVSWRGYQGNKLEGFLIYPEDFDADKSYPMICYFYERNVDNVNRYETPSPSRSIINKTLYASNGYIVFVPDITYRTGYPGQSAYDAIVSGVHSLTERYPFIDSDRVGIQGQSWGGYQTAYLVTQTDIFAAAMGGAIVSNMTSAYGGIRWDSGLNRMFQYEHTQSRIGGTLWEKPLRYIDNSPLFHADKITTPLMLMHNDKDGAVPWYQGIEMLTAMRRLDKPCWMVSYNNESHNLNGASWGNRVDLSKRMFGFFNHYLKGDPIPEWMDRGIPTKYKHRELRY